ncbi:MAG: type III polyketide synthase [Streptosporangiaceae bacterium]
MTQIAAVRSALPPHRYAQAEITGMVVDLGGLDPVRRVLVDRLHGNSGVKFRHLAFPIAEYRDVYGLGPSNERYVGAATGLGEQALRGALGDAGVLARELDLLIVTSVTGVIVPSIDALLIPRLGLRPDIKRLPVFGLGCVAGAAALARLHDYLLAWPGHTAALVSVEVCSLCWPRAGISTADLIVSGLFGDGSAAVVARGGQAAREHGHSSRPGGTRGAAGGPQIIATHSEVCPDSNDALGWRLGSDGFRIVLTPGLSDVVERELAAVVTSFLARQGLTIDDIGTWMGHPGGPKVIDAVQHSLKLPDSAMAVSRRSLAEVGNLSSASVLHVMEMTQAQCPPPAGSYGVMIGLGPGVSVELILLQW